MSGEALLEAPAAVAPIHRMPASLPTADPWEAISLRDAIGSPPSMLLGCILPEGRPTLLYGDGETGKSLLAAAIAVSLSIGLEVVPGWIPAQPCPVLVIDWETDAYEWQQRAEWIARGVGVEELPAELHYIQAPASITDGRNSILRQIEKHRPGLVVVDSMGWALPLERENEDPRIGALAVFSVLRNARVASLSVDHVSKGGGLYGSVYKRNAAREAFKITGNGAVIKTLRHTKANNRARLRPMKLRFEFDEAARTIRFLRGPVDPEEGIAKAPNGAPRDAGSMRSSVFALLDAEPDISNKELIKRTGAKAATIRGYRSQYRRKERGVTSGP